ncbi:MAG: helix-turn-helix transcriptional regulator [Acidobacteria bacterium]|nr:helix-turn-helix transcriptional regulator [Acidobacteriota bacterium]MBV9476097.1 helix-turn-helix transcriptional regulator [Acidobacteriota bacterium]
MNSAAAPVLPSASFLGDLKRQCGCDGLTFSEVIDRADVEIPLHTHRDAHFFLLLRGAYETSARGADGVCGPATLLFVPRWTTHRDRFTARGGSFFTMSIAPETLARLADGARLREDAAVVDAHASRLLAFRAYEEFCRGDAFSPAVLVDLTLDLLVWAARDDEISARQPPRWLRRALDEIEAAREPLTVKALAASAGVHPLHFAKVFRRFQRCAPGEYLRKRRVAQATELLARTRTPIADVALQCGFSDQSQLTKALRRHAGMTPARFRRAFQS